MKQINQNQNVQFTITRNNKPFTIAGDYQSVAPIYESLDLPVARKQAIKTTQSLSKALNVPKLALGGLKQELRTQTKIYLFDALNGTHYRHDYKVAKKLEKMKAFESEIGISYSK